ncbi:MAG: hypothetical protein ABI612_03670 [Betaproteobacteria bacterium]
MGGAVEKQWFTGSLEAPSPALPKAGIFAIEPYVIYTRNTGTFDDGWGHQLVPHDSNQLESLTVLKYGLTDRLTIQGLPSFAYLWNDQSTSSGVGAGDLPVELEYRLKDQNNKTGSPSVTVSLGMSFPIADYDRLRRPLDGMGSGAYTLKEGLLFQSLFDTWGDHPLRLRVFGAAFEPVAKVSVHDVSVYGTGQGFQGQATPGFSAELGIGVEYGLDQRWVLALDVVQSYGNGFRLNGADAAGNVVSTSAANSTCVAVAPALEYNWSGSMGLIVGVAFSAAGRNASSYIAPQLALSLSF